MRPVASAAVQLLMLPWLVQGGKCWGTGCKVKGVPTGRVGEALFRILISVQRERIQCSRGCVLAARPTSPRRYLAQRWPVHWCCSLAVAVAAAAAAACTDANRLIRTRCRVSRCQCQAAGHSTTDHCDTWHRVTVASDETSSHSWSCKFAIALYSGRTTA